MNRGVLSFILLLVLIYFDFNLFVNFSVLVPSSLLFAIFLIREKVYSKIDMIMTIMISGYLVDVLSMQTNLVAFWAWSFSLLITMLIYDRLKFNQLTKDLVVTVVAASIYLLIIYTSQLSSNYLLLASRVAIMVAFSVIMYLVLIKVTEKAVNGSKK